MHDLDKRLAEFAAAEAQLHSEIDRLIERVTEIAAFLRGQVQSINQRIGSKPEPNRQKSRERVRRARAHKKASG